MRIIDDNGAPLPTGEVGEIAVSGPRVMAGYWRNEAATKAAIPDGWYRTGDLGRCDDDGHYTIAGRKKDMIITGGENVYPMEVENALLEHPAVAEAAVFGIPSERWGEEVRAVVVLNPDAFVTGRGVTGPLPRSDRRLQGAEGRRHCIGAAAEERPGKNRQDARPRKLSRQPSGESMTADTEKFRLRHFVERLVQQGECVVHDAPIALIDVGAVLEGNPKAVWFKDVGPEHAQLVGNVMGSRKRLGDVARRRRDDVRKNAARARRRAASADRSAVRAGAGASSHSDRRGRRSRFACRSICSMSSTAASIFPPASTTPKIPPTAGPTSAAAG